MKDNIKNGLIIFLIVLIGLFGFFGGKKVTKYAEEISTLKYDKTVLELQKGRVEAKIKLIEATLDKKEKKIDSCMVVFKAKDKIIAARTLERDEAIAKLNGITSDSSYQFLQKIAYNFPGTLEYLFNALQVKGIHTDYLIARSSEQAIPLLSAQVDNCKLQFIERDRVEADLKNIVSLQKESIGACEKINNDNDKIIKDTEKQRDKEARRKGFWRFTTAVSTTALIVLAVFGL
jgi:hypothetical protein